jgi:DNA-binding transcriptional LysR family regulator
MLELDAMLGTLDFVARTDWVAILPGVMMATETRGHQFTVNPLTPAFGLDLVLIEPSRRPLSASARTFLDMLEQESVRLNVQWDGVRTLASDLPLTKRGQPPRAQA